jgi:hypothetical protein
MRADKKGCLRRCCIEPRRDRDPVRRHPAGYVAYSVSLRRSTADGGPMIAVEKSLLK